MDLRCVVCVMMMMICSIGAAFTRHLSMRYKDMFPGLNQLKVISYGMLISDHVTTTGPCQWPTLGFVVERSKEVTQFEPVLIVSVVMTTGAVLVHRRD